MTPDSGVLINKNKNNSSNGCGYSCFSWTIDAHPEDINKVDFLRPRTKTPVMRTIGDYRQLNDALFHAGTELGLAVRVRGHANRLHFYVLNTQRDATGVQSYDVAIRNLDGAGPAHARRRRRRSRRLALNPARRQHLHVQRSTTPAPPRRSRRRRAPLDNPNAYVDIDVYRLTATGAAAGAPDERAGGDQGRPVGAGPGVLPGHRRLRSR